MAASSNDPRSAVASSPIPNPSAQAQTQTIARTPNHAQPTLTLSALSNSTFDLQAIINLFRLKPAANTLHYRSPCEYLSTPQAADGAPISWNCPAAQPLYCCPGYYCASPGHIQICPSGKFCPRGSIEPQSCHFLASCPEGTAGVSKFGIAFLFGALMLIVSLLFSIKRRRDIVRQLKYRHLLQHGYGVHDESANVHLGQAEQRFKIEFKDLGLTLPSGVEIMRGVSGEFCPSRVCAILGPSGAGKTTLASLLTGKAKRTSGQITIN
ncbi:hypothetical protein THASP1DRAFT_32988, partial [Thamnocephalis sphaerospora]